MTPLIANCRRYHNGLRPARALVLACALGASLAGDAAAATATTALKTSTTKIAAVAQRPPSKATGAKLTSAHSTTSKAAIAKKTAQSATGVHHTTGQTARSTVTAKGSHPTIAGKGGTALAKNRKAVKWTPRQRLQAAPTPERYKEIQQALADRGFYKGEVNGAWGVDSVAALQEFQVSQKLTDDGKISSLTLIGLGLGPKHSSVSGPPPPVSGPPQSLAEPARGARTGPTVGNDPTPAAPQGPPGSVNSGGATTIPHSPAVAAPAVPQNPPAVPQNTPAAPSAPSAPDGPSQPGVQE